MDVRSHSGDASERVAEARAPILLQLDPRGGKVVEAEFDDETEAKGIVEFEIMMADGSEQEVLYTLADGSMTVDVDDDDDGDHDGEAEDDGENEADDDK